MPSLPKDNLPAAERRIVRAEVEAICRGRGSLGDSELEDSWLGSRCLGADTQR